MYLKKIAYNSDSNVVTCVPVLKNLHIVIFSNTRPKFVRLNPLVTPVASAAYTFSASPKFHHLETPVKPDMQRGLFELMLKVLNSFSLISVGFLYQQCAEMCVLCCRN